MELEVVEEPNVQEKAEEREDELKKDESNVANQKGDAEVAATGQKKNEENGEGEAVGGDEAAKSDVEETRRELETVREQMRFHREKLTALRRTKRKLMKKIEGPAPKRARLPFAAPAVNPPAPVLLPPANAESLPPPARVPQVPVSTPRPQRLRMIPARYRDDPPPAPARSAQATRRARAASQVPGSGRPQSDRKRAAKFDD